MIRFNQLRAKLKGRTMLWLIGYEAQMAILLWASAPWLYLQLRVCLMWTIAFSSLLFLAVIEKRRANPLPFMESAGPLAYAVVPVLLVVVLIIDYCYSAVLYGYPPPWKLRIREFVDFGEFLYQTHVGIYEESFKVALTNGIALWRGRSAPARMQKVIVVIAGTSAVALWAYAHVFDAHYTSQQVVAAFFIGIALFAIVYRFKNYVPAILLHMALNLFFH